MKKKHKERIIPVFILAVCVFLYHNTYQIPPPRFEPLGSSFFPRFILVGMMLLSVLLLVKGLFFSPKKKGQPAGDVGKIPEGSDQTAIGYTLGAVVLFGIYILLISITDFPYLALTFFFMVILGWFLSFWKIRALPLVLVTAFSVTLIIYLVFGRLLGAFFP